MGFGERIRQKRTELGWTQDALATKANLSKAFLSELETGKRGAGAKTLLDISTALGVSIDYLMTGAGAAENAEPRDVGIPAGLVTLAREKSLSLEQTLVLLDMQRQIVAHRSTGQKGTAGFDWGKFYESVREYL